jgi:hypothetical protein
MVYHYYDRFIEYANNNEKLAWVQFFLGLPFLHVDLHNASRNPAFLGQQTRLQKYIMMI